MKQPEPFRIVHEDDDLVAVDKAAGIAVLADRWDDSKDRLDELLNAHYASEAAAAAAAGRPPRLAFPHRVFVVHRVDRDTSGLVVFAKSAEAHRVLSGAFEARAVAKAYLAVVHGRPAWPETSCDLPLRVDGDRGHRTVIDKSHGKPSLTAFRLIGSVGNLSLLLALPASGRTHQIRAHLASLGYPIVCDPLYGDGKPVALSSFKRGWRGDPWTERPLLSRLGLHALRLRLAVPRPVALEALPARDMASLISQMAKCANAVWSWDEAQAEPAAP